MIINAETTKYVGIIVWRDGAPLGACREIDTDTKRYTRFILPDNYPRIQGDLPTEEGTYDFLVAGSIMTQEQIDELRAAGVEIKSYEEARNEYPWAGPVEWAWCDPRREYYTAGFKTKEEAVEHARWTAKEEGWEAPRTIAVGYTIWPEPGMYVSMDAGDVAEQTDENAFQDGCYTDDEPLFDFDDQKKAQEELVAFLRRWANKHLKPCKWTFKEVEKIEIGACEEDGAGGPEKE